MLGGDLEGDFGLAGGFPALEEGVGGGRVGGRGRGLGEEGFVAREGRVGALGCDFACWGVVRVDGWSGIV